MKSFPNIACSRAPKIKIVKINQTLEIYPLHNDFRICGQYSHFGDIVYATNILADAQITYPAEPSHLRPPFASADTLLRTSLAHVNTAYVHLYCRCDPPGLFLFPFLQTKSYTCGSAGATCMPQMQCTRTQAKTNNAITHHTSTSILTGRRVVSLNMATKTTPTSHWKAHAADSHVLLLTPKAWGPLLRQEAPTWLNLLIRSPDALNRTELTPLLLSGPW